MIKVIIVGGSHDGETMCVDDDADYVELMNKQVPILRFNVADSDTPMLGLKANIETYRINPYRGTATLC